MENETGIWKRTVRVMKRLYFNTRNYRAKAKDIDFRTFSTIEYAKVSPEDVKDLKRLEYIKCLDLAKKGYIDGNLKSLLVQGREKERLVRHDHKISTIGRLEVLENETILARVRLGFEPGTQSFFMASNNHDNIPLWKTYDFSRLRQSVSDLHPAENNILRFDHTFLGMEGMPNEKGAMRSIHAFYNEAVQQSFDCNPYFKASLLSPSQEVLSSPDQFLEKKFQLPLSEGESTLMTLTEATERYLVFQSFLKTAPKPVSLYFSSQEFKERFLDSKIELIALLKHDLRLGIHKGILYVGTTEKGNGKIGVQWETYERRMQSKELSAKVKFYLAKEIITNKNFVVEKDAILLKNDMQMAYLKKHYATGDWHYAEVQKHHEELHFRSVDKNMLGNLRNQYPKNNALERVFGQIRTDAKEQTLKIHYP